MHEELGDHGDPALVDRWLARALRRDGGGLYDGSGVGLHDHKDGNDAMGVCGVTGSAEETFNVKR